MINLMVMATTETVSPTIITEQEPPIPWSAIAWFAALLIFAYLPVLISLVKHWNQDEDMGHAFFVPVVAGYIVWCSRTEIFKLKPQPAPLGFVLILWGIVQLSIGALGSELFLQRTAFLITTVGILLLTGGFAIVRALFFPLFLLLFMIPIPAVLYNQITFPLQIFASRVAENVLLILNIPVLRDGNVLELASQKLSVVEACSGIRSLLSLSFLSLIYGYFFDSRPYMRYLLLATTIPIAIAANAARVSATGILSEFNPELARGLFHVMEGWVVFMVALVMLVLTHQLISRILDWQEKRSA